MYFIINGFTCKRHYDIVNLMIDDLNDLDDFLDELDEETPADLETSSQPEIGEGQLSTQGPPTSRQLAEAVGRVYNQLGGDAWLLQQAKAYPKEFMQIIKGLMPKEPDKAAPPNINLAIMQASGDQIRGSDSPVNIVQLTDDENESGDNESTKDAQTGVLVSYTH